MPTKTKPRTKTPVELKTCPRCGVECDKLDVDAVDEVFGYRYYKGGNYTQSQCKQCRSKEPLKPRVLVAPDDYPGGTITVAQDRGNLRGVSLDNVVLKPRSQGISTMTVERHKTAERDALRILYCRTYPKDVAGPKRSVNFMKAKLKGKGVIA